MKIYTSCLSEYNGLNKIDITIKSGNIAFAPTWDMVMKYRKGKMSEKEYTSLYYDLMKASMNKYRDDWIDLISRDEVVLCCYCRCFVFCHRLLLKDILIEFCSLFGIKAEYIKEI